MKILIAEDDRETADYLAKGLAESGMNVTVVANGPDALFHATQQQFDAIILDRMLPGIDGLAILRMIRAGGIATPVLLLTAMAKIAERVEGLESGADDYLVKPFAFSELRARLNVLIRRPAASAMPAETMLRVRDLELDLRRRRVTRGGIPIDLQPREVLMLEELMRNSDRIMTKTMLLERVWEFDFDPRTNIVETHISRLRAKLNAGFDTDAILTVRGAGYTIRTE
ncbi:MAG: response regulator transcription factor [Sphingomonas sp.]|uniref:response regulator n=1 Tax=unclassified Sphingomonas TaxID=196159 RepID=UPI0024583644|nr:MULTISPECIES: response regulator transcription factor [unclassified Sphingomonas]MBQ1499706.1 response regulator transcription factor [Sphingomonas sp.]MDH4743936.1 response regulator transcription factor [Sphingomonas sp. CBMAI 2297]